MADAVQCCFQRYERKYLLTPTQQEALIRQMSQYVEADKYPRYTVCSIYYDTDDWRLIRASMDKPYFKEKLRMRSYGTVNEGDRVFAELKKKCGEVVYKRRVTAGISAAEQLLQGAMDGNEYGQIGRELQWFSRTNNVSPKVFIAYDRQAFAGKDSPELRITFDTDIRWRLTQLDLRSGDHGQRLLPGSRILMEIKFPEACPLWLSRILAEMKVFPVSFSKYGLCYKKNILEAAFNKKYMEVHLCA